MANIIGTWELVRAENIEAYFKQIKVPDKDVAEIDELFAEDKVNHDIITKTSDGKYHIQVTSNGKLLKESSFTPGQVHKDTTWDDRVLDITINIENDNKLVEKESGPYESTIIDEVSGNNLTVTMTSGDVTAVCRYKRV